MDFYLCEGGIDYNENDEKCTNKTKIIEKIGYNNSLEIEFYYPEVQFQPTNKIDPMIVLYRQYYYHLTKYSNKIDKLYLQEHTLSDDSSLFIQKMMLELIKLVFYLKLRTNTQHIKPMLYDLQGPKTKQL